MFYGHHRLNIGAASNAARVNDYAFHDVVFGPAGSGGQTGRQRSFARPPSHVAPGPTEVVVLIFGWHNVEPSWFFPCLPGEGFVGLSRQLQFLKSVARVVPLGDALDMLAGGHSLPPRAISITFDDGYRDTLDLAIPILTRLGLPATFFLVPGFLSRDVPAWWEELAWAVTRATRSSVSWEGRSLRLDSSLRRRRVIGEIAADLKRFSRRDRECTLDALVRRLEPLGRPEQLFMDWDDAREVVRHGFEVGSHSMSHCVLSRESTEEQERELTQSRAQLEERLDVEVRLFAYPNGTETDYDHTTITAARRAGYRYAVTTRAGRVNARTAFEIRRQMVEPAEGLSGLLRSLGGATSAAIRGE